ncbi:MAG: AIR synthase family protein [Lachnospiraceae bacterium]|nr:AIR synthase family protein [Lachnospiraceae bacterium]
MKIGKVPENVLKRSILKKTGSKRSEVLIGAGVGEDCACVKLEDDEVMVLSTDPITGTSEDIGLYAVNVAVNDLASSGATPIGILVTALLPINTEEEDIKAIMKDLDESCKALNIQIMGGHTEITKGVTKPVLSLTAVGKVKEEAFVKTGGAKPGNDVVITKWIGLEGTSILAKEKEAELLKKFPPKLIYDSKNFDKFLSVVPEAAPAVKSGVTAMHDVTEGGVFGALWELAESSGVGLLIDLRKIPVKQETVEICNFFDINPYELMSGGSMLMTAEDGNRLVMDLQAAGIEATIIGKCTDNNDRVLINGEMRRFLEPAKTDELYKVI